MPARKAAAVLGVHLRIMRRYANAGQIPNYRTQSGQRRHDIDAYMRSQEPAELVGYARVRSDQQRNDLQRQIAFL